MTRGEKLKKLRKQNGNKTQKEVLFDLEKIGKSIDKNTLSNAENDANISNTTLEILAYYYNVPLDYLKIDSIENSSNENININKILNLNDSAIENLKNIDKENINTLNEFLSDFPLDMFLENLKTLKYNKLKHKKLRELYRIYELRDLIQYYNKNQMKEELKEIFYYFDNIFTDFKNITFKNFDEETGKISVEKYLEDSQISDIKNTIDELKKRYLDGITEKKVMVQDEEIIINTEDFSDLNYIYGSFLKQINSDISLPKYLANNVIEHYLNSLEGFNSIKELKDIEKSEKIKEYLKKQKELLKK